MGTSEDKLDFNEAPALKYLQDKVDEINGLITELDAHLDIVNTQRIRLSNRKVVLKRKLASLQRGIEAIRIVNNPDIKYAHDPDMKVCTTYQGIRYHKISPNGMRYTKCGFFRDGLTTVEKAVDLGKSPCKLCFPEAKAI